MYAMSEQRNLNVRRQGIFISQLMFIEPLIALNPSEHRLLAFLQTHRGYEELSWLSLILSFHILPQERSL